MADVMGYDTAGLTSLSNTINNGASSCRTMLATMYEAINGFAADEWFGTSYDLENAKDALQNYLSISSIPGTVTTSNEITLAAVAATGAANELTVTSGTYGGSTATTNAQTALNNLASSAVLVYKSGTLSFSNNTATITISGADLQNSAITEIRDSSHNVVECDVVYTDATTITVTANGNPTGLYAIVHYKKA